MTEEEDDRDAIRVGLEESSEKGKIKFKWLQTGKTFSFDMSDVKVECILCGREKTIADVVDDREEFNMPRDLWLDFKDGEDFVHIGKVVLCSEDCAEGKTLEKGQGEYKGRR